MTPRRTGRSRRSASASRRRAGASSSTRGAVAEHLGTDHHEQIVRPRALELLPRLVWALDEPFADASMLPTYYVSEMARRHVTVALSGMVATRLYAGYTTYAWARQYAAIDRAPRTLRRLAAVPGRALPSDNALGRKLARLPLTVADRHLEVSALPAARPRAARSARTFARHSRSTIRGRRTVRIHAAAAHEVGDVAALLHLDARTYMIDDVLVKVDRTSMQHSLEVRVPLLDHQVLEFVARLPFEHKLRGGVTKWILRETVRDLLPAEILARGKQGFGVPLERWLGAGFGRLAREVLLDRTRAKRAAGSSPGRRAAPVARRLRERTARNACGRWSASSCGRRLRRPAARCPRRPARPGRQRRAREPRDPDRALPPGAVRRRRAAGRALGALLSDRHRVTVVTRREPGMRAGRETRDGFELVRLPVSRVPVVRTALDVNAIVRTVAALSPRPDLLLCFQTFVSGFAGVRAGSVRLFRRWSGCAARASTASGAGACAGSARGCGATRAACSCRAKQYGRSCSPSWARGQRLHAMASPQSSRWFRTASTCRLLRSRRGDGRPRGRPPDPGEGNGRGDRRGLRLRPAAHDRGRRSGAPALEARPTAGFTTLRRRGVPRPPGAALPRGRCVVLASRRGEGLPNVLLEAMATRARWSRHRSPAYGTSCATARTACSSRPATRGPGAALRRLQGDRQLAARLGAAGRATAEGFGWDASRRGSSPCWSAGRRGPTRSCSDDPSALRRPFGCPASNARACLRRAVPGTGSAPRSEPARRPRPSEAAAARSSLGRGHRS